MELKEMKAEVVEKRRIAKPAAFILFGEIFERYSTAGVASILLLFLNLKLGYDKDMSTAIYHSYEFVMYISAILGAIIADSCLGMYRSILLTSIVFVSGSFIIAVSVVDVLYLPLKPLSIFALLIVQIGGGSLKPLCSTYGAYQYKPTEVKSIALFFSLFYFMYNCGSVLSRFINPILRQDVKCFGNDDCFALAFGIPGIFMVLVAIIATIANRYSETKQLKGTTLMNVFACIRHAIVLKIKSRKLKKFAKKDHWLDYSEEEYGKTMVRDTRVILKVLVLSLPIMVFWALFFQQGSRWVFQAVRMNGDLGFYTIKPDQLNVINPILVLILIPVFDYCIYHQLAKVGITTSLQKVTFGGVLAGVAFLISAIVESQIDSKYLSMAWMVPQYLVMAMGEVMISIPLLNFSYSEAPNSMKTILPAFRVLSIGLGNLIVVIVAGSRLIDSQTYEFLLFAGLMFVDMIIFGVLAKRYKRLEDVDENVEDT